MNCTSISEFPGMPGSVDSLGSSAAPPKFPPLLKPLPSPSLGCGVWGHQGLQLKSCLTVREREGLVGGCYPVCKWKGLLGPW